MSIARPVVADQPMLTNGPGRKILDLDSGTNCGGLVPGRLNHGRRIQQALKPREPRRQDGLLLEGLQVVIVGCDLPESAGFIETLRVLDVKLMPQALNARLQYSRTFAGDGRYRCGLKLDL